MAPSYGGPFNKLHNKLNPVQGGLTHERYYLQGDVAMWRG
ncbi:hypothetical protein KCP78_11640 [Salmonella enterica subsp. enterica]|nr:hypothetical protein KCP78_11640 [Salmonella enterica subsp. enterica]